MLFDHLSEINFFAAIFMGSNGDITIKFFAMTFARLKRYFNGDT